MLSYRISTRAEKATFIFFSQMTAAVHFSSEMEGAFDGETLSYEKVAACIAALAETIGDQDYTPETLAHGLQTLVAQGDLPEVHLFELKKYLEDQIQEHLKSVKKARQQSKGGYQELGGYTVAASARFFLRTQKDKDEFLRNLKVICRILSNEQKPMEPHLTAIGVFLAEGKQTITPQAIEQAVQEYAGLNEIDQAMKNEVHFQLTSCARITMHNAHPGGSLSN